MFKPLPSGSTFSRISAPRAHSKTAARPSKPLLVAQIKHEFARVSAWVCGGLIGGRIRPGSS